MRAQWVIEPPVVDHFGSLASPLPHVLISPPKRSWSHPPGRRLSTGGLMQV